MGIGQELKLQQQRFRLDIRKHFGSLRLMKEVSCLGRSLGLCLEKPLMRRVWAGLTLPRARAEQLLYSPSSPLSC